MEILSVSIDLTKIDKSKIKKHSNGSQYYNLTVTVYDEKDQYGNNVSVIDSQSKEEREAKAKRNFIGNGKVVYSSGASSTPQASVPQTTNAPTDDLPF